MIAKEFGGSDIYLEFQVMLHMNRYVTSIITVSVSSIASAASITLSRMAC